MINVWSVSRKTTNRRQIDGFALPTILIASIIMLSVLLVSVASTAAMRTSLAAQYYNQLAQNAGDAGLAYAKACLSANSDAITWTALKPLKPDTDCSGNQLASCPVDPANSTCHFITLNDNITSTFVVNYPTSGLLADISSQGSTKLLRLSTGTVWRTYSQSSRLTIPTIQVPVTTVTLTYNGSYQNYIVPVGVTRLTMEVWGAQGGSGGNGGYTKGVLTVVEGETLRVYVGGQGIFNDYCNLAVNQGAGYNGGGGANCYGMGGGGATDIRRSPYALANRIIVAGGGGGVGVSGSTAGAGGGLVGVSGSGGTVPNGTGGTQSAGGTVSTGSGNGSLGQGGYQTLYHAWGGSGGGGGGYYGGAAGGDPIDGYGGNGGGGSAYVDGTATGVIYTTGVRTGNGQAIISGP